MTKAFAYLRVSGESQVEGGGFPRQEAAIRDWAARNDHEIVKIFKEEGVSGKLELDDRPALQALLAALEENGVKTVIIEKLDRLARQLMVQETILADMQARGCTLISTAEADIDSDDPTRVLVRQIMGVIAEYDRKMIVSRLRSSRNRKKREEGRCEGAKPYGHYPGEKDVLEMIAKYTTDGWSSNAIAMGLNQMDVKPRSGQYWHASTISGIQRREGIKPPVKKRIKTLYAKES
jgi:DNA invertase Pin-like site-specific DNA recombinase